MKELNRMMYRIGRSFAALLLLCALSTQVHAQRILNQAIFGGNGYEKAMAMKMTEDGNFVLAGQTNGTTGVGEGNHGDQGTDDIFIMKVTPGGRTIWRTILGGSQNDEFSQLIQTQDKGFAMIGSTLSRDGDVKGKHGGYDLWVIKIDKLGQLEWTHCYGGSGNDMGFAICQVEDGTYYIGGESGSKNGDIRNNRGGLDGWIAQIDGEGKLLRQRVFGGKSYDRVKSIWEMDKGHILVFANTKSLGGNIQPGQAKGKKDVWVFDLSRNFDIAWQKNIGGSDYDDLHKVIRDKRGDFIVAGTTFSMDGDLEENKGGGDFWMFKMQKDGVLLWSKAYGGLKSDGAQSVVYDPNGKGSYMIVGQSNSYRGIVNNYGLYDGWVVKTDTMGGTKYVKNFGGKEFENIFDVVLLPNGNYMMAGFAESVDRDLAGTGKNKTYDAWLFEMTEKGDMDPYASESYLAGYVTDKDSGWALEAEIVLSDNSTLKRVKKAYTAKENGIYTLGLPDTENDYSMMILAPGYMFYGQDVPMDLANKLKEVRIDTQLEPLRVGSKLILGQVQFDIGSFNLRPESFPELSRLIYFLGKNTNIKVEISGHTDNTGNVTQKMELSLKRAERVRNYLLKGGVPGGNMTVKGYGLDQPIADNKTKEGRDKNRRVEFKVIEIKE